VADSIAGERRRRTDAEREAYERCVRDERKRCAQLLRENARQFDESEALQARLGNSDLASLDRSLDLERRDEMIECYFGGVGLLSYEQGFHKNGYEIYVRFSHTGRLQLNSSVEFRLCLTFFPLIADSLAVAFLSTPKLMFICEESRLLDSLHRALPALGHWRGIDSRQRASVRPLWPTVLVLQIVVQ
jgi:hypothetical protein